MPQRRTLGSQKKQQKVSVSPALLMFGTLCIACLFLAFNLSALRSALQKQTILEQPINVDQQEERHVLQDNHANAAIEPKQPEATPMIKASTEPVSQKSDPVIATEGVQYQIIFSTGCSAFQDWQSYVFFFHAAKALRNASPPLSAMENTHVTRIASGCSEEDATVMKKLHEEQISIMTPRDNFHLHITPDFSYSHGGKKAYKYFNKPYGTKHWMENILEYKQGEKNENKHDNDIIILMDPDQIIMRPFTNDFSKNPETWRQRKSLPYWDRITRGQPFAQQYGFHNQWLVKTDITKIAKPEELPSPIQNMTRQMTTENFAAGPPYIATGHDFYKIAHKWAEFAVPVHKQYPYLLAEMFAYCLAAAHLNLPHQITQSFMISDAGVGGIEGWQHSIDKYSEKDVCTPGAIPVERLPNVLHYCQRYWLGKWFIGKYKLPKDFISCKSPLLMVPPDDIALKYDFAIQPGTGEKKELNSRQVKRNAFMICYFIPALNEAARFYKEHHCQNEKPNMEESLIFHSSIDI